MWQADNNLPQNQRGIFCSESDNTEVRAKRTNKMEVLESLHGNVVCALAAGIGDYVRCTLLEYSYHDGQFWIFTEGGEKFIGLERNKNVSLAVFEKPPDFGALKSVLVMGTAKLIEPMLFEVPGFDEYSENLMKSSMIGVRKISFGKESVAETREIPYNNAV